MKELRVDFSTLAALIPNLKGIETEYVADVSLNHVTGQIVIEYTDVNEVSESEALSRRAVNV